MCGTGVDGWEACVCRPAGRQANTTAQPLAHMPRQQYIKLRLCTYLLLRCRPLLLLAAAVGRRRRLELPMHRDGGCAPNGAILLLVLGLGLLQVMDVGGQGRWPVGTATAGPARRRHVRREAVRTVHLGRRCILVNTAAPATAAVGVIVLLLLLLLLVTGGGVHRSRYQAVGRPRHLLQPV